MRIVDWSSDVCSSVLLHFEPDLLIKILRDVFNEDFSKLVISGPDATETISAYLDRKSVVKGKSVSVSVDLGGRRNIKKKKTTITTSCGREIALNNIKKKHNANNNNHNSKINNK